MYRARDTKLQRDVALKVLPDLFLNDPERLARFQREALVLASLNHPHIGAIYGLEESERCPGVGAGAGRRADARRPNCTGPDSARRGVLDCRPRLRPRSKRLTGAESCIAISNRPT